MPFWHIQSNNTWGYSLKPNLMMHGRENYIPAKVMFGHHTMRQTENMGILYGSWKSRCNMPMMWHRNNLKYSAKRQKELYDSKLMSISMRFGTWYGWRQMLVNSIVLESSEHHMRGLTWHKSNWVHLTINYTWREERQVLCTITSLSLTLNWTSHLGTIMYSEAKGDIPQPQVQVQPKGQVVVWLYRHR